MKCKLKCYVKPMKDPLGVSPSRGNQGTTRGKEKNSFDLGGNRTCDLRTRSTVTPPTELRGRTEKVGLVGLSWVLHFIYTSELILCSTIFVHSATRHNMHMYAYFVFAAIHPLNRPRLSLSDLVAQSAR